MTNKLPDCDDNDLATIEEEKKRDNNGGNLTVEKLDEEDKKDTKS